jgi:predicted MFS family arabinose efflux permease
MKKYFLFAIREYFASYKGLPGDVWVRVFVSLINSITGGIFFFLSLYFVKYLHLNIATAGLLLSAYGVGTTSGGIISGRLSDRYSANIVSVVSIFVKVILFALLVESKELVYLVPLVFLLGFFSYGFLVSNKIWLLDRFSHDSSASLNIISISSVVSNVGSGSAALLVTFVAPFGFSYIFSLSSIMLLISVPILLFSIKKQTLVSASQCNESSSSVNKNNQNKVIIFVSLFTVFMVGLIVAQKITGFPVYIHDMFPKLGIKAVGMLFLINPLLIIVFQTQITRFIGAYNKLLMIAVGAFLMGFGSLLLSFSYTIFLASISCVIYTIGEIVFFPIVQILIYRNSSKSSKGAALGLFKTVYAFSLMLGPAFGGLIYHLYGGFVVWYFSFIFGLFAVLSVFICRNCVSNLHKV